MTRRLITALVLVLAIAPQARAQDATLEGVEQALTRWMSQYGVSRATLAIAHGDRLVLAKGYGGLSGERRVLIASLTKPITGVCTATLIQQGKLRFDTTLGELLPRRYGEPRDARLRTVTVAQLLTHRAGFSRSEGDPATDSTLRDTLSRLAISHATMLDLVPGALRAKLEHEPGAVYEYTNAGHLLLGVLIEAVTGQSYEEACAAAVLAPQGIRGATLHPAWGVLGSFGGWNLSGPEYLAFLRAFAPSATLLSAETRQWMLSPAGKETTAGGPLFYSLLLVRPLASGGHNFFHTGSWTYRLSSDRARVNESLGTLAVSAAFGASWFVYYEPQPGREAVSALDREMYRAVQFVRTWPD